MEGILKKESEMNECTFKPAINATSSVEDFGMKRNELLEPYTQKVPSYTFDRLYENAFDNQYNKDYYLKMRWKKEEHECTFRPKINDTKEIEKKLSSPAFERLYEDHSRRRLNQRKLETLKHKEEIDSRFAPQRVTKSKDKEYGLTKEPFYQKFNRLFNDHEKKTRKRRMLAEVKAREEKNLHEKATANISGRRSSLPSSRS
mmetsp:Transcript_25648/g.29478  ORF Transcript_25648/g.29478 Transcript_25648/m.29478 type:complete len:202 (+) Transcript_25648:757-1362(+)